MAGSVFTIVTCRKGIGEREREIYIYIQRCINPEVSQEPFNIIQ